MQPTTFPGSTKLNISLLLWYFPWYRVILAVSKYSICGNFLKAFRPHVLPPSPPSDPLSYVSKTRERGANKLIPRLTAKDQVEEKRSFLGEEYSGEFLTLPVVKLLKRREEKIIAERWTGFDYLYNANPSVWQIRMIRHTGY